jgi:cell division protein YceG involved in septum cleavage
MKRMSLFLLAGGLLAWAAIAVIVTLGSLDSSLFSVPLAVLPTPTTRAVAVRPTLPPLPQRATSTAVPATNPDPTLTQPVMPTRTPTMTAASTASPSPVTAQASEPPSPAPVITATVVPTDTTAPTSDPARAALTPQFDQAPAAAPSATARCEAPQGWVAYTVTNGDTLFGFQLGSKNSVTVDQIMKANCLPTKLLSLGQTIFLPPGAGQNAPKVDDGPSGGPLLPAGLTRKANCPCTLNIRAGWRREQIAAAIDAIPVGFTGRDFLAVTNPNVNVDGFGFLTRKPAAVSLEGFLYPGSYPLQNETTAQALRDMMLKAFGAAIPEGLRNDAAARGLTFYEAIVLASIVQRESYAPVEQVRIASVMYNRMAAGKALSSTVTVQYAIGRAGAWWPRVTGADLKNRSRYNTYIWLGLTPSPISNPDFNAINATIHPADTNYQYFNTSCDGPGNFYTATYEEFEAKLKECGVLK